MQSKKGFTLVELLAVVVILGIILTVSIPAVNRWINKGKNESLESQKNTLLIAAQSYGQANSKILPKSIGETATIQAKELKESNYLKSDLMDADKNSCMDHSFVKIYKKNTNDYKYIAYLYCGDEEYDESNSSVDPVISIDFSGNESDENIQEVAISSFKATIEGGNDSEGKTLKIDGYSYSISVAYTEDGEIVEIFHSGSLAGNGESKIEIEKSLGDYTDISSVNRFLITVEAYNEDGGYSVITRSTSYQDTIPPTCGEITGQAGENEWFYYRHTSKISVQCIDNADGSGCVRDTYIKSFNTEMVNGVITIFDNAGNHTDCTVRVHHDWSKPTCTPSKSHTYQPDGVDVSISCYDAISGVKTCPAGSSRIKSSQTYTVEDIAGNTNTCRVTVSITPQSNTKSCSTYKACNSYDNGTCGGGAYCTTYAMNGDPHCYACGLASNCCGCKYYPTYGCYGRTAACGCESWGGWSGWTTTGSCSPVSNNSTQRQCRTVYY